MTSSGPDPRKKAGRCRRRGASASHDSAGIDPRSPLFAAEARRQSEAARASSNADNDQAFVDSISEFDSP
ncbi:antitoxin MazE family protein [Rhizobium sp. TRM96647]|nr:MULTISPECIES: antitoxin MazE family protein [unclassified Rhizobium]MCV3737001.1 antitoxin MazE family protein [Rhizobium sp. TRM96647]MCV3756599.1 antitoxin MazE family protein [Rhizobium sp. TRM96650]